MEDLAGVAWARRMFGTEGPHVRDCLPRVLAETHSQYSTLQVSTGLPSADPYGLIWLGMPNALVEGLFGIAGVRAYRPRRARYRIPVINSVPLIPWRFAKDKTTDIDQVPFGRPVSASKQSLFTTVQTPLELDLGESGLGDSVVNRLSQQERQELDRHSEQIAKLATEQLVGVLAYSSNPEALLSSYFGFATLRANGLLSWAFRESLELVPVRRGPMRPATTVDGRLAFDAGKPASPLLRPRVALDDAPSSEPPVRPHNTATDE
ncbi:hypothetical protein [Lentzea albida]|uniref:Uncharacterized protein n=1 Tax=Lentzea albida TaxID=65499 RepID=A0A1H9X1M5_9PSEU|nr:hypothetical protein [Lentzea albida]SES39994.1 hypothetical protein SAMN04488000_12696 [Lentzea albida]